MQFTVPLLYLYVWANVSLPVAAIFIAEMLRYRRPGKSMANIAGGLLAIVYVGMMLQLAVWFRLDCGVGALATWIVVVKMGDTGAYAVGRLIGRHKMAPLISPGKTIEGALGALGVRLPGVLDHDLPRASTFQSGVRGGVGSLSACWSARRAWWAIWPSRC